MQVLIVLKITSSVKFQATLETKTVLHKSRHSNNAKQCGGIFHQEAVSAAMVESLWERTMMRSAPFQPKTFQTIQSDIAKNFARREAENLKTEEVVRAGMERSYDQSGIHAISTKNACWAKAAFSSGFSLTATLRARSAFSQKSRSGGPSCFSSAILWTAAFCPRSNRSSSGTI